MLELAPRISVDPSVRFGKPVVAGTRIPVDLLVSKVAGGMSTHEVAEAYGIETEDVQAALSYAAALVSEQRVLAAA